MVAESNNAAEPAHASFDGLLELEQTFYQAGFDGGFPHGELHGLFEGRELGREKSWELWEEIGYYEGTAKLWQAILQKATPGNVRCGGDFFLCLSSVLPAGPLTTRSLHTVDLNRACRRSALSSPHFPPATTRLRCETSPSHSRPTSTSTRSWARFGQSTGQAALLSACVHAWRSAPDPMARRRRPKTACAVSDRPCNAWPSR